MFPGSEQIRWAKLDSGNQGLIQVGKERSKEDNVIGCVKDKKLKPRPDQTEIEHSVIQSKPSNH
jgi:hypothetical protein